MGEFGRRRIEKELAWHFSVDNLLTAYEKAFSKVRGKHRLESIAAGDSGQDKTVHSLEQGGIHEIGVGQAGRFASEAEPKLDSSSSPEVSFP
jgi:hypothetical protein